MYAKNAVKAPKRRERRRHPEEFKRQVVEACLQPGISMAAVALANGLNANLVRRWVKDRNSAQQTEIDAEQSDCCGDSQPPTLVPVTVSASDVAPTGEIKIEIHRQQTVIQVTWPVSHAAACAQWLREVLR
jgi:transposase